MIKKHKIFFPVILTFLVIFQTSCKKEKNRICDLYNGSVGYAIGTIDKVKTSIGKATYVYSFLIDGVSKEGEEKAYGIGQSDETLIGKRFVVVYSLEDSSNSDLNTDFIIDTDLDFQEFEVEYENSPPSPDFPNKCK